MQQWDSFNVCAYISKQLNKIIRDGSKKKWNICWAQIADAFEFLCCFILSNSVENMTLLLFYYDVLAILLLIKRSFQRIYTPKGFMLSNFTCSCILHRMHGCISSNEFLSVFVYGFMQNCRKNTFFLFFVNLPNTREFKSLTIFLFLSRFALVVIFSWIKIFLAKSVCVIVECINKTSPQFQSLYSIFEHEFQNNLAFVPNFFH